jgi:uncharacterized protein involved in exopolysaccharide biosynthesis
VDLRELGGLLANRWLSIVVWIVVPILCAVVVLMLIPSRYTATTSLLLDPRGGAPATAGELAAGRLSQDNNLIESQVRLVSSVPVLRRVVRGENLVADPEFTRLIPSFATPLDAEDAVIASLADHLTVRRPERTIILDVDVWSWDRAKAARLADAVAAAFIEEQLAAKTKASGVERERLEVRMRELDTQIAAGQRKTEAFKAQHHLVDAPGGPLDGQTLVASNAALDKSQAEAIDARERLAMVRRLLATPGRSLGALPDALHSNTVSSLRTQYAEAQRRYDALAATLGPRHPALQEARKEIDGVQGLITAELQRIADSLAQTVAAAQGSEKDLAQRLQAKERTVAALDQDRATLDAMQRDVDANRVTYTRLRDADALLLQQGSMTPIARQLAPAVVPLKPSFPRIIPTLLIVAAVGVSLALLQALLRGYNQALSPSRPRGSGPPPRRAAAAASLTPQKKRRLYAMRQTP